MQERNIKVKKIIRGDKDLILDFDSDEDQSEKLLKIGDLLDYKIDGTFISVVVIDTIEDMIKIKGLEDNI